MRAAGVTKTPPSAENAASMSAEKESAAISGRRRPSVRARPRESPHGLSLALRTEQPELDEILDVENPDGTLAVDDDDAVDLELLEELHRLVQKAFLAERHRVLRVADLAERLVENRAAVALQPAAQVPVGEDADGPAVGVDDRDRA